MSTTIVEWVEVGGPDSDVHHWRTVICGVNYTVTEPRTNPPIDAWHAFRRDDQIGWRYDDMRQAMEACARTAGLGRSAAHRWTRSRESLCSQAWRLVKANGGPDCTFAALKDSEIWELIQEFGGPGANGLAVASVRQDEAG